MGLIKLVRSLKMLLIASNIIIIVLLAFYIVYQDQQIEKLNIMNENIKKENKILIENMKSLEDKYLNIIKQLRKEIESKDETCKKLLKRRKKLDEKLNEIDRL